MNIRILTMTMMTTLVAAFALAPLGSSLGSCGASYIHTYAGSALTLVSSDSAGVQVGNGQVQVYETNTADCNGDGQPGEFDGDYETGQGGGFFPSGPWATHPCWNYDDHHYPTVSVIDLVVSDVHFQTGADDISGPIIIPDPTTGGLQCTTDGTISPGDPAFDPTADADDCLSQVFVNSGYACDFGGDGGYWVILLTLIDENGVSSSPTSGFIVTG